MSEQHDYREVSDPAVMAIQPLVSVHMLAYRHEKFLAEAIEGVVAQVCDFPIELIIAEDCSPDATLAVALDYQRRYPALIRIITGDKNVGMHANAARSMSAIRGKYIALCEGDDYWQCREKLAMQVEALEANPAAMLVHSDFDHRIGNRFLHHVHKHNPTPYLADGDAFIALMHKNTIYTVTVMCRKAAVIAFDEADILARSWPIGDYPMALYIALMGPIIYLPISTSVYRKVHGSATNKTRIDAAKIQLAMHECREVFLSRVSLPPESAQSIRVKSHQYLRKAYFFANAKDNYMVETSWLTEHNAKPNTIGHVLFCLLLNNAMLLKIYRTIIAQASRMRLQYRLKKHSSQYN